MAVSINVEVNGVAQEGSVEPRLLLVHFLRENLGLTGTHVGCETSMCGACTVLLDGQAVKSCTLFAVQADQGKVTTIEGLKRTVSTIRCRRAFGRNTACNAVSARPG